MLLDLLEAKSLVAGANDHVPEHRRVKNRDPNLVQNRVHVLEHRTVTGRVQGIANVQVRPEAIIQTYQINQMYLIALGLQKVRGVNVHKVVKGLEHRPRHQK